jgi:phospholipid-binding lipoprotein MlaA
MNRTRGKINRWVILQGILVLFWAALTTTSAAAGANDPLESVNRSVYKFNKFIDKWALKPTAKAYKSVTPDIIERGVANVFRNFGNVPTSLNNLLQGKPGQAGQDLARFIFNLTFGGLGFYDFASDIGLPVHQEDFGQTLGVWGVPDGPYIVLPILGPSSLRDTVGWGVDQLYEPFNDIEPARDRTTALTLRVIDARAQLLQLDNIAPGDEYLFLRDAYLQRRTGLIADGKRDPEAEDDFLNDDF